MKKHICLLFALLLYASFAYSQDKTFKETKSLQEERPFIEGEKLTINGERTFLTLRSWDKPTIQVKVEVISRHSEQAQAKNDLDFINVIFNKRGKAHIYSNALQLKNSQDKPKSSLKVILEIYVPHYAEIEIENHFGKIDIKGDYKSLKSNSDFSTINITSFEGDGTWSSRYGDATLVDCHGSINFTASKSNLILREIKANLTIDINHGELAYYYSAPTNSHSIKGQFSPIQLYLPRGLSNPIDIKCKQCAITSNNAPFILNKSEFEEVLSASISPQSAGPKGIIYSELEDVKVFFQN